MSDKNGFKGNCGNMHADDSGYLDVVSDLLYDFKACNPELAEVIPAVSEAYVCIAKSLASGGILYLCGNGGSMADAFHISGELLKSYLMPRPLSNDQKMCLLQQPYGNILAEHLEQGLRAVVLGSNPILASAVENDNPERNMEYAQHLWAMGRSGDVIIGISTSGKAKNVRYAVAAGKALGLHTIALTGKDGGPLAQYVDIAIRVPVAQTARIQEQHVKVYHLLCAMLEKMFFGN